MVTAGKGREIQFAFVVFYYQKWESLKGNNSCSTHNILNRAKSTPGFQEASNY